jgi:two-component system, chemotaxis family, response regulator WspR
MTTVRPSLAGEPAEAGPDTYSVRVLLVDDQPIIGEAVRRALAGEADLLFRYCPNSAEALDAARVVKPTVILQDLVMPGVTGIDLVRQYRADPATRDTPIIVLSTREEPAVKGEAFAAGANDYLVKLPDRIELIARIRYHSRAFISQIQRDDAYRALRETERQLKETNAELQRLNNLDGLTKLGNRRYFDEHLEVEWKRAVRTPALLSLLMIDVDHFKQYNDTYGHLAGDDALRKVAQALGRAASRGADLAARFGGEEFAVLLPATDAAGSRHVGEQLCRDVEDLKVPHRSSSVGDRLTVSIGVATLLPSLEQSALALIAAADQALYRAKEAGRNGVVSHDGGASATEQAK